MLGSELALQMHVKSSRGSLPKKWRAKICLFSDGSHLDRTMPDAEK